MNRLSRRVWVPVLAVLVLLLFGTALAESIELPSVVGVRTWLHEGGLSGVRLGPYLLGTAIGLVPWSVPYVGIGASAASIDSWTSPVDVVPTLAVVLLLALSAGYPWWPRRPQPT